MKGCFYLQRNFAYIGHTMALLLKERYGFTKFCGYVSVRPGYEFLKGQKDIVYTKLVLEEDIIARHKTEQIDYQYLAYLEREYGIPNLWPYIMSDRVIRYNLFLRAYPSDASAYSHEDMMKILQVSARAVIAFLEEEKPNFIVFSVTNNLSSLLLYHIAKKKGITTIVFGSPRIGIRYLLSERYDRSTFLEAAFREMRKEAKQERKPYYAQAKRFLMEFQGKPQYFLAASGGAATILGNLKVNRFRYFVFFSPARFFRSAGWIMRSFREYLLNTRKDDYIIIKPWNELRDKITRRLRVLRGYADLYDEPVAGESYGYFALHTEPEGDPMVLAPFYLDQIWLAKQIARSLPLSFKLYVKDHPVMVGLRPRSYYEELRKIPNVRLINPARSGLALIEGSQLTLTITGTSGFEAVLLKKPVIIFGAMYYDILSSVKRCAAITDLPVFVKEQVEQFTYNEPELLDFLAAAYAESVPVELIQLWDIEGGKEFRKNRERLEGLVNLLAEKLFSGHTHYE